MQRIPRIECHRGITILWDDLPEEHQRTIRTAVDALLDGDPSVGVIFLQKGVSVGAGKKRTMVSVFLLIQGLLQMVMMRMRRNQRIVILSPAPADMPKELHRIPNMEELLIRQFPEFSAGHEDGSLEDLPSLDGEK